MNYEYTATCCTNVADVQVSLDVVRAKARLGRMRRSVGRRKRRHKSSGGGGTAKVARVHFIKDRPLSCSVGATYVSNYH